MRLSAYVELDVSCVGVLGLSCLQSSSLLLNKQKAGGASSTCSMGSSRRSVDTGKGAH